MGKGAWSLMDKQQSNGEAEISAPGVTLRAEAVKEAWRCLGWG